MDSALRPREIQSRIRAGQSLEEVARVAGVPIERIEAYALPVLAEREHVAGLALASTIRRRGEAGVHRNLRPVVRERLTSHRIDPDTVTWDAWRNEDRRWTVKAMWTDDETHTATFLFDLRSRFSVAVDKEARWLISEASSAASDGASEESPQDWAVSPAPRPVYPDDEPTVTLADIRSRFAASAPPATPPPTTSAKPATAAGPDARRPETQGTAKVGYLPQNPGTSGSRTEHADDFPRSSATPLEIGEAVEAEINNYGVIPDGRSELDLLYDMLGGITEDSINIYAGLADPVVPEAAGPPHWAPKREPSATDQSSPAQDQPAVDQPRATDPATTKLQKPAGEDPAAPVNTPTAEDGQPKLTDNPEATVQLKPGASKRRRKGRAQVPSWEEIMFGSPKAD